MTGNRLNKTIPDIAYILNSLIYLRQKLAILGFTEFFKGETGNQNLEIPSEIAEKRGIQP